MKKGVYKISTGIKKIDAFFTSGLPVGKLYHIYGPSESGKTTFALHMVKSEIYKGNPVIWVDTEGKHFETRLVTMLRAREITPLLRRVLVFRLKNFNMQSAFISKFSNYISPKIRLVVFDTITNLYRDYLSTKHEMVKYNKELNRQTAILKSAAINKEVAVILLNQVKSVIGSENQEVSPVAETILNYWSDYNIELVNKTLNEKELNISIGNQQKLNLKFRLTRMGIKEIA